jgi:DNA-binding NarL/FixJ family response regulator
MCPVKPLSVIVAQSNPKAADALVRALYNHFRVVTLAGNIDELRGAIPQQRADVAILDLEMAGFGEVKQLRREFPRTTVVCTHRLADEQMWTEALAAGAADCCCNSDVRSIVMAASQTVAMPHAHAA